jgi:hypothetical protein
MKSTQGTKVAASTKYIEAFKKSKYSTSKP